MAARKPSSGKPATVKAAAETAVTTPTGIWIGAGIGSAAIAAALLYAARAKKKPFDK